MNKIIQIVKSKKIASLLAIAFLMVAFMLFRTFVIIQVDHSHLNDSNGCSVCITIQNIEYLFSRMDLATKMVVLLIAALLESHLRNERSEFSFQESLVKLKIRMNN